MSSILGKINELEKVRQEVPAKKKIGSVIFFNVWAWALGPLHEAVDLGLGLVNIPKPVVRLGDR